MGVKFINEKISEISKEKSLRFDFDFLEYYQKKSKDKYYQFKELFHFYKGDLDVLPEDNFLYAQIWDTTKDGDVMPVDLNFSERNEINEDYYKKIEKWDIMYAEIWNILLSKVRPNLRKFIRIDEDNNQVLFTKAFLNLKPTTLWKILYYWFRTIFYEDLLAISRQWKWYPTLKEDDLLYLKFDKSLIDKLKLGENTIISQIEPIERKIKQLKSTIKPIQEVIDWIFSREFSFNIDKYNSLKYIKSWNRLISDISTDLIRFTSIQLSPSSKFLQDFLSKENTSDLNDFLTQDIKRWTQPIYVEEWIPVVKTKDIQWWKVIDENFEYVPEDFFEQKKEKEILKYDILLTSTWMWRWKFALYDYDEKAIADSHVSIIRFDRNKINYKFLNFYLQSFFGTGQLKYIEMQTKGTPEIYEQQLKYLKIINVSKEIQERIVEEIQAEIDKQDKIRKEIQQERNRIDEIIEKVILSNE